ncbi:MAG: hypothetical protein J4215_01335 [Candidatus Diapherotrites archaeon]|uniref:Uncharacterized protein n=1 Tax=Candidatus Iainarchaeum sp. TaxID=3101447 RepID=A0A8T4L1J5_9ARCH|nr:hypothetical protein [Candidatus Diapherotrites archaeon]
MNQKGLLTETIAVLGILLLAITIAQQPIQSIEKDSLSRHNTQGIQTILLQDNIRAVLDKATTMGLATNAQANGCAINSATLATDVLNAFQTAKAPYNLPSCGYANVNVQYNDGTGVGTVQFDLFCASTYQSLVKRTENQKRFSRTSITPCVFSIIDNYSNQADLACNASNCS